MSQIILNLKRIRVQIRDGKQKNLYLKVDKKGDVNAGMIDTTEGVEILNQEQHIATITESGTKLKFDMVADIGRGFVPAEAFKNPNAPIGTIFLDAIFSPVKRVNYRIEKTRVGQRTDYEKLFLDVWTDKTIKPDEALALSARILKDHINLLIKFEEEPEMIETEEVDKNMEMIRKKLNIKVSELELSVRSNNVMKQAHIKTLGDLVQKSEAEMLKFRNFGKKSLAEMNKILKDYGLTFGMEVSKYKKTGAVEDDEFEIDMVKSLKTEKEEETQKKKKKK
jgi:DNA-directed RNA polymerase subunit alpha